MQYTNVTNLKWDKDNRDITCLVTFDDIGQVSFAASAQDIYAYGREIYARCIAGEFGPIAEHTPGPDEGPQELPPIPPEQQIPVTNTGSEEIL